MGNTSINEIHPINHMGTPNHIGFRGVNPLRFTPPRVGLEPTTENQQALDNKTLTENENPVLSTGLDKILQKYPELAQLVEVWPNLPEHIKTAIKALLAQTHNPKHV